MGKRKLGALEKLEADLPALQNKIRRDPISFEEDFVSQYQQYRSYLQIFQQNAASDDRNIITLREYIDFIAHVADCYRQEITDFPTELVNLLVKSHDELDTELREKIVGSLVLLRNKDVIDSVRLLDALFPVLLKTHSKSLREMIYKKIISDLKSSNAKTINHRLNRSMQNTLFNLVTSDKASTQAWWGVKITRELWRRQIWTEAKAVEVMKEAALADNEKVIVGGVRFFLGGDREREEAEEESEEEDAVDMKMMRHQMGINKKTKKRSKELKKAAATVKKKIRKKNAPHMLNFSALHLLHDPQDFAEALFQKHVQGTKSRLSLDNRLLVLQLVTRLVGLHKLTINSLYSYFIKFLTPRQISVTAFLACLAQATHGLVPPEDLSPLIHKIANEFVSEASASEVASSGLNAIREICVRQPLAMDETLLQDLVMYRKSKDKGVMMAAKGLLSLYRNVGAEMLKKRDRGKEAAMGVRSGAQAMGRFGDEAVDDNIVGIELLEEWKEEERQRKRDEGGVDSDDEAAQQKLLEEEEAEGWKNWDAESNASDDSGGWIDVVSDGEAIEISDSDGERPSKKQKSEKLETPTLLPEDASTPATVSSVSEMKRLSNLATTRILTPADLAKLRELQAKQAILAAMPSRKNDHVGHHTTAPIVSRSARHADDPLTAAEIEGLASLSHKATKEEKLAKAKGDRDQTHSSTTAIRKEQKRAAGKSTTNKEKARQKNFLMTLGKAKGKGKRSLKDVRIAMRGHVERSKKGGRRGNRG